MGGKWRVGSAPNRHSDASGRIIRYIYNQLKDMKMLEFKQEKYTLTSYGKSFALEACNDVKTDAKNLKKKIDEKKAKEDAKAPKKDEKAEKKPKASQKKKKGEDE